MVHDIYSIPWLVKSVCFCVILRRAPNTILSHSSLLGEPRSLERTRTPMKRGAANVLNYELRKFSSLFSTKLGND